MKPLPDYVTREERLQHPPQTNADKLAAAKRYLGERWLLHPANAPRKRRPSRHLP